MRANVTNCAVCQCEKSVLRLIIWLPSAAQLIPAEDGGKVSPFPRNLDGASCIMWSIKGGFKDLWLHCYNFLWRAGDEKWKHRWSIGACFRMSEEREEKKKGESVRPLVHSSRCWTTRRLALWQRDYIWRICENNVLCEVDSRLFSRWDKNHRFPRRHWQITAVRRCQASCPTWSWRD